MVCKAAELAGCSNGRAGRQCCHTLHIGMAQAAQTLKLAVLSCRAELAPWHARLLSLLAAAAAEEDANADTTLQHLYCTAQAAQTLKPVALSRMAELAPWHARLLSLLVAATAEQDANVATHYTGRTQTIQALHMSVKGLDSPAGRSWRHGMRGC